MNISEAIPILKAERIFKRTPCGRSITDIAAQTIDATLADEKNYDLPVFSCISCCIMVSSLLAPSGCPNCNLKQKISLKQKIKEK